MHVCSSASGDSCMHIGNRECCHCQSGGCSFTEAIDIQEMLILEKKEPHGRLDLLDKEILDINLANIPKYLFAWDNFVDLFLNLNHRLQSV